LNPEIFFIIFDDVFQIEVGKAVCTEYQHATTEYFQKTPALLSWYSHIPEQEIELYLYEHQIEFKTAFYLEPPDYHIYGIRGDIKMFSRSSRLRLMKFLASLPYSELGIPFFVTLTYHQYFPESYHICKDDLHHFLVDLKRRFPDLKYIWKMEFQKRGAPHFHIIVFLPEKNARKTEYQFKRVLFSLWKKHLQCGCFWCSRHSVKVQKIQSFRRLSFYVSKYMAQVDETYREEGTGRFWGRSKNLYERAYLKASIDLKTFDEIREYLVNLLRKKGVRNYSYADFISGKFSFFVFLEEDDFRDLLDRFFPEMRPPPQPAAAGFA
jgi:hypothetical protein